MNIDYYKIALISLIINSILLFCLLSPNIIYFIHKKHFIWKKDKSILIYFYNKAIEWFNSKDDEVKVYLTDKYHTDLRPDELSFNNKLDIYEREGNVL